MDHYITAIAVLNSARIRLDIVAGGFTSLVVSPRSFVEADVVSGETLWLTFALNDILLVMTAVTYFALGYSAGLRGHIEGLNMVDINRVGGIVWVGRPLLFLRSLVAILFLSTTDVQLSISGIFTRMGVPQATGIQRLTTVLAGSETCWLVIVLTDLGLVVTKDHTSDYSLKASILAMVTSIVLSATKPVEPTFTLARTCDAVQVDLQLACHAGVIEIGSFHRVVKLVIVVALAVVLCFA
ncbi:Aste57867_2987 [Aphanomyces stellatus]|uniref:Aste57867_2987 protein n=1 Tax=Aphanomyces stellatus TaxID=120398 RepID=A0A485KB90_9STRA|nr:hypothetical protein As57867_002978 [Aphanomyces stellatus]VFT80169.1 Aste57867_2987 [Aphanomyces stellatus]